VIAFDTSRLLPTLALQNPNESKLDLLIVFPGTVINAMVMLKRELSEGPKREGASSRQNYSPLSSSPKTRVRDANTLEHIQSTFRCAFRNIY
jgi:hypothetical protein